jgi:ribosomal protein S18 acetylase RimI-like enzyme
LIAPASSFRGALRHLEMIFMSHYIIGNMTLADYDHVIAFWEKQTGVGLNESDSRDGIATFLQRNPGMSLVVWDRGEVIGAVLCGHDGRRGFLHHLAVAESHRGLGIGRALVTACLEKLKAAGILKCNIWVWADNDAGSKFWLAMGYINRPDLKIMQRSTDVQ